MAMKVGFNRSFRYSPWLWICVIILAGLLEFVPGVALSEPVTLKFATTIPPTNPIVVEVFEPWAKKVNEASKGELNIQVISGPTLANALNVWERTVSGVADIGWGIHGAVGIPFPRDDLACLLWWTLTTGSVGCGVCKKPRCR
jgi:hypothetical protein